MQVRCPACEVEYEVPDEKVPPEGLTTTCKMCGYEIDLSPTGETSPARGAPVTRRASVVRWVLLLAGAFVAAFFVGQAIRYKFIIPSETRAAAGRRRRKKE